MKKHIKEGVIWMKRLALTGNECMACIGCELACSRAFYKTGDPRLSCIQIREKNGKVRPAFCVQCGKCAKVCEAEAITKNPKGVYMINKNKCIDCGKCIDVCPFDVIIHQKGSKPTKCIACGICIRACPVDALEMKES